VLNEIEWCVSPNYGPVCGLASDTAIFRRVKAGELWEPEIVVRFPELIRPGSIAIDAGANIGLHSIAMAARQPEVKQVIAFEPHTEIFRCLINNTTAWPMILPLNKGLGREAATLSMQHLNGTTNPAGAIVSAAGKGPHPVELVPLDSLPLSDVSLIKIDVEGMEMAMLAGAMNLLKRERPALIVEILNDLGRRQDKIDWLCSLGYSAEPLNPEDVLFTPLS